MISTQLDQEISGFDEMIAASDSDFAESGLKAPSLIRVSRLAVVNGDIILGKIGQIDNLRLNRIKQNLSQWLQSK
jgi:mRNA interferase MazF